jgi:hypothetical protein
MIAIRSDNPSTSEWRIRTSSPINLLGRNAAIVVIAAMITAIVTGLRLAALRKVAAIAILHVLA